MIELGEVPHDQTPLAMKPQCPEQRVLKKQLYRVFEVAQESLRNSDIGTFSIVFGGLPKINSASGCSE